METCRTIVHRLMTDVIPTLTKDYWKRITEYFFYYKISQIAKTRLMESIHYSSLSKQCF